MGEYIAEHFAEMLLPLLGGSFWWIYLREHRKITVLCKSFSDLKETLHKTEISIVKILKDIEYIKDRGSKK